MFATRISPSNSELFLQTLLEERQDFAQRIMIKRLVMLQRWLKRFAPAKARLPLTPPSAQCCRPAPPPSDGSVAGLLCGDFSGAVVGAP